MQYKFGARSRERLKRVHPDLVLVLGRAIQVSPFDLTILEGARTLERQRTLVDKGASQTMNSRHLIDATGICNAVDVAPYIDGRISWDWPLYHQLSQAMKNSANELGISIEWGGDWTTFKDGPHWQIPW
jgi:peptidoglycan L-alanyl-D-glutamate endopeptidase CwlK